MSARDQSRASVSAGYVFVLSVIGLAAVFYWGYASFFILETKCPVCITMYVAIIGIFLTSSGATDISMTSLANRLIPDLRTAFSQPVAAVLAIVWLLGSTGLVAFFKGSEGQTPAPAAAAPAATAPAEALDAAQVAEWHAWLDAQPRAQEMAPAGAVKVLLIKFNDYQCPSCRATWAAYRQTIETFTARYPGTFAFETRDFPLEPECGAGGVHTNACEAAVAVRLARSKGQGPQMETWLFENQESLSRGRIKDQLKTMTGIDDYDTQYATVLDDVRKDSQLGKKLGVSGTPTFFLNGIKMPSVRVSHLEDAITYELGKAGVSTQ
jgi:protein-disulfide isomerase